MKTSKGLTIAEKIAFVLSAVLFFVSTFLPIQSIKQSTSSSSTTASSVFGVNTFAGLLGLLGGAILLIVCLIGFAITMFGDQKKFAVGNALYLAAPLACLIAFLSVVVNLPSTASFKVGVGTIMLMVSIVLYIVSVVLHAIDSLLTNNDKMNDVDDRIALVRTYKEFKDEGVITEEEYQAKKNEILQLKSGKEAKK